MVSIAPLFLVACLLVVACLVALGLVVRSRQPPPGGPDAGRRPGGPGGAAPPSAPPMRSGGSARPLLYVGIAAAVVLVLVAGGFAALRAREALTPKSQAEHRVAVGPGLLADLIVSPRGGEFAVATDRGAVQIRSVEDGSVRLRLDAPLNDEIHLAYSGDGALIAAGGELGVYVWDVTTGKERARIPLPDTDVRAVALSPDGKRAILLDDTHLWAVELARPNTRRQLRAGRFVPPGYLAFGPDGSWAAGWQQYANQPIVLFDPGNGNDLRTIGRSAARASFTPDGRTVLIHERNGIDELVRYDTTTGERIGAPIAYRPSGSPPNALSPDGTRIAAAEDSAGVHRWDAKSGRELGEPLKLGDPPLTLPVTALAYTDDGDSLLVGYFDQVEIFAAR